MRTSPRSLLLRAATLLLALAPAACSGDGDDGPAGDAARDPVSGRAGAAERSVQFVGAGNVRRSGTFSTPAGGDSTVPGVLVVPTAGAGDRNGLLGATGVSIRWAVTWPAPSPTPAWPPTVTTSEAPARAGWSPTSA